MRKMFIYLILIVVVGVGGFVLIKSRAPSQKPIETGLNNETNPPTEEKPKEEIIDYDALFGGGVPVCEIFPKEKIEDLSGLKFVEVKPGINKTERYTEYYCEYREEKLPYSVEHGNPPQAPKNISISFVSGNIQSLKEVYKLSGERIEEDKSIPYEHHLVFNDKGKFLRLEVFLTPNLEMIINTWWSTLSQDEALRFVKDYVLYFKDVAKEKSQNMNKSSSENSKEGNTVPLPQDEDVINIFFNLIDEGDAGKAALMMNTKSDQELQAWAVQFASFDYVKVVKIEKANESEWTDTKHIYKVTLNVRMKKEAENAPVPYYGYQNGENVRFIKLEKVGNIWKISDIGSGY